MGDLIIAGIVFAAGAAYLAYAIAVVVGTRLMSHQDDNDFNGGNE